MIDNDYQKADKILPFDHVLRWAVLWLFPKSITPNHVTLFRFITTPVVVGLIFQEYYRAGVLAFLLVASTDAIDGALARTRDQVTKWGTIYDPLADKLLIGTILYVLVFRFLALHLGLIIIALDLIIIVGAFMRKKQGIKICANVWGKLKMLFQTVGITLLLLSFILNLESLMLVASYSLYLAIGFAIVSIVTHSI
jgi:cardiolipin synthase